MKREEHLKVREKMGKNVALKNNIILLKVIDLCHTSKQSYLVETSSSEGILNAIYRSLWEQLYRSMLQLTMISTKDFCCFCLNPIYKSQCMCVCPCISAIEIQTTLPISMKFGTGILLNGGKVRRRDLTPYTDPRGQGGPKQGLACLCSLNRLIW
jgi:hypothetical protein